MGTVHCIVVAFCFVFPFFNKELIIDTVGQGYMVWYETKLLSLLAEKHASKSAFDGSVIWIYILCPHSNLACLCHIITLIIYPHDGSVTLVVEQSRCSIL